MTQKQLPFAQPQSQALTTVTPRGEKPYTPTGTPARKPTGGGLAGEFESLRADYEFMHENRFIRRRTGLAPRGGGADYHFPNEWKYYEGIEKARDMDRNDAIIGQTIDRAVQNIVQSGFTLDVDTGDIELNDMITERWQQWAEDAEQCDTAGESTFAEFESSVMRAMLLDGDCVVAGTNPGPLQFFEAHSIQGGTGNNTYLGVELNDMRRRLRYYVATDPIEHRAHLRAFTGEHARPMEVRNADGFRQLFHIYKKTRTSLTRGVSALAPVFAIAGMAEDVNFAKVVQQQIVSCFAIFRQRGFASGGSGLPSTGQGYGQSTTETSSAGQTRYIEGVAPGMEIIGEPGEELKGFSPEVPNSNYFEHIRLLYSQIGVNLGMPIVLVLLDTVGTTFHGYRGALDEARKGFRVNQDRLRRQFHIPCYKWKLNQWINQDFAFAQIVDAKALANPMLKVFRHKWNAPDFPYIEPVKDAQGDLLQVKNGMMAPREQQSNRGKEHKTTVDHTVEDNSYSIRQAIQEAAAIKQETGVDVHWREVMALPMADGIQINLGDAAGGSPGSPGGEAE